MNYNKVTSFILVLIFLSISACTPQHFASSKVEFLPANAPNAESTIRGLLPSNDPTVSLSKIPNSTLYEIRVCHSDRWEAAKRANEITKSVASALLARSNGQWLRIQGFAEPRTR